MLIFSVSACQAQPEIKTQNTSSTELKSDKINSLLSTYFEYGKFNGSALVVEKGEVIYKHGFGLANMEWDIPNETDTKFRLASVSKQFTAMVIMILVAENKIELNESVSTYLPWYPKENAEKISIHHLLTHSSGIPNYTDFPGYRKMMRQPIPVRELIETFADSTLEFTPGEKFNYSNSGYALLGAIAEEVTGQEFAELLRDKIFTPLNMSNSGFANNKDLLIHGASGYDKFGDNYKNTSHIDMSVAYTAGGVYSTVEDLFLWDQALYTEKLLPKEYLDLIFQEQIPAWGKHYGYGWLIGETRLGNSDERIKTIDHDGSINGFSSLILRIPSEHSSVILLNNTGNASLYEMARSICGILYDKSYNLPKQSLATAMLKVIKSEGLESGLKLYEESKSTNNFMFDENEMNLTGYDLLQSNLIAEADAVFQINVDVNPASFNAYDSYAESQMRLGNTESSIQNYKKSLKLNPENENAILMLEKLGITVDREKLYLLKPESTWTTEIFSFPLRFAPGIQHFGTEEAHFPPGWRDVNSNEHWSYTFAWDIDLDQEISIAELENYLQIYFDGLMDAVNRDKSKTLPKSVAKFKEDGNSKFSGTLKAYDSFVSNEVMTLNTTVESHYCPAKQKSILLFKFSPSDFDSEIWETLNKIKLRDGVCEE